MKERREVKKEGKHREYTRKKSRNRFIKEERKKEIK
jgi:hypothetical protein